MTMPVDAAEETISEILLASTAVARANHLRRLRAWHVGITEAAISEAATVLAQYGLSAWITIPADRRLALLSHFDELSRRDALGFAAIDGPFKAGGR
jgi:hypothetical protein